MNTLAADKKSDIRLYLKGKKEAFLNQIKYSICQTLANFGGFHPYPSVLFPWHWGYHTWARGLMNPQGKITQAQKIMHNKNNV